MALFQNDKVSVKTQNNNIIGTGTLILNSGWLELRVTPRLSEKYKHIAVQSALTILDNPEDALAAVAGAVIKGIWGTVTHTNMARVKNPLGSDLSRDMKELKDKNYNLDEIRPLIWICHISKDTVIRLKENQILIGVSDVDNILEFLSAGAAKKCFIAINNYIHEKE